MKKQLAIIGACCSRDMCNGIFVDDWKEHLDLVYYSFQTSFISLVSLPIPYSRKLLNFEGKQYSLWYRNILSRELNKTFYNDLLSLKPDNLLIDFYSDVVMGVLEIDGCTYMTQRLKDQKNSAAFQLLTITRKLNVLDNYKEYMTIWKDSINKFLIFMKKYLPETRIILNALRFSNDILYSDGSIKSFGEKNVETYNKIYSEMVSYVSLQDKDIILLDLKRTYFINPDYVYGGAWIVHFHNEYYQDMVKELGKLCMPPDKNISKETSNNLFINGDFKYGTLFYKYFDDTFSVVEDDGQYILQITQKENKKEIYAQVWSYNIPIVENQSYTICFDCKVSSQIELSDGAIAVIRTFNREEGTSKADSVEQIILRYNGKGFDKWSHYSITIVPKGKFLSVGMYCTKNGCISWKDMGIYHQSAEPVISEKNVIEEMSISSIKLLDVNRLCVFMQ